jgi:predicted transposase YbfD/YdcC
MNEDMSRARTDNAAVNLATLRRIAVNMINLVKGKTSIRAKLGGLG